MNADAVVPILEMAENDDDDFNTNFLIGSADTFCGAEAKEIYLQKIDEEYNKGNVLESIFYQVRMFHQLNHDRFCYPTKEDAETTTPRKCNDTDAGKNKENKNPNPTANINNKRSNAAVVDNSKNNSDEYATNIMLAKMNTVERQELKTKGANPLIEYAIKEITKTKPKVKVPNLQYSNFLRDIKSPLVGIEQIEEICQEFPKEWTIIQLTKGFNCDTTYSKYYRINKLSAPLYFTLLRHARSDEYPQPICIRFDNLGKDDIFAQYCNILGHYKSCVTIDTKTWTSNEDRECYWNIMEKVDQHMAALIEQMKNFIRPWRFLFVGIPFTHRTDETNSEQKTKKEIFKIVDNFCNKYRWDKKERVLLSLAALHVEFIDELEIYEIVEYLTTRDIQQKMAVKLLQNMKPGVKPINTITAKLNLNHGNINNINSNNNNNNNDDGSGRNLRNRTETAEENLTNLAAFSDKKKLVKSAHYPVILIIDERLDQFCWEEMITGQEYARNTSLFSLRRLYRLHKHNIQNGYLKVNIIDGGCVINPEQNLPNTANRMKGFFDYWTPNWLMKTSEEPKQNELFEKYFTRDCYVYAGHGSGAQFFIGEELAEQKINSVVFLFGCDSTRLLSKGFHSELIGPHIYYHAANCPAVVGLIMPGLDSNMDLIASEILSRWIAPTKKDTLPWFEIATRKWIKEAIIEPKDDNGSAKDMNTMKILSAKYQKASLCEVLACIHQRHTDKRFYNTVPYVFRGLPVWNINVQSMPNDY